MATNKNSTVLAFDYGERRIGVAVGNTLTKTAEPLKIIQVKNKDKTFEFIELLIREWQPEILVVGLPMHPDGGEHAVTLKVKKFSNQLRSRFNLRVLLIDERYTSVCVVDGNDALAAQLILAQYLSTA